MPTAIAADDPFTEGAAGVAAEGEGVMDGAQLDAYYSDQLYALEDAVTTLANVNYIGLTAWLKAKATWTDPPLPPATVERLRECLAPFFSEMPAPPEVPMSEPYTMADRRLL